MGAGAFRKLSVAGSVAVAMALAGCASVPNVMKVWPGSNVTTVPAIAPSATATVKPGLSIERWWTHFGDATLNALMDEALARNEDLEAAVARVKEAQASLAVASAARSPTLDLQTENGRQQRSTVTTLTLPPTVDRRGAMNTLQLVAGYELDLWGKLASGTEAARNQLLATEWARSTTEWGITARLADAYFGIGAVDRQIEITKSVRASRAETLKLRQREYGAGAGNELDLRRAEAEVLSADASLASLERQRVSLERALTVLLGRTPAEIVTRSVPVRTLDERKPIEAVLPQGAVNELLVRRPDVRQSEAQLAASNYSIEAARAATLPSVRLSGMLGTDARSIGNLFSGPATIWSLAANLSQSLVDGGRLRARVDEEQARAEQALASYRKTVAGAVLDVREAYAVLDVVQQSLEAEHARVAALARARELSRLGYDNGALSYLDVLDADRNWYQAQVNEVAAYRDRLTAQVAAFKALGGGYVPAVALSQTTR